MDNTFLAEPRRARTRAIAAVVVLASALAAAGLVRLLDRDEGRPAPAVAAAPSAGAPSSLAGDPEQVTSDGAPAAGSRTPLQLVRGTRVVNGVRVGYPHTLVGAVSAAIEYGTQLSSQLDPKRGSEIGLVIADSSFGDTATYFAQGRVNSRRFLGLPESGTLPAGTSVSFSPVAYQVRDVQADRVTVLLLAYLTSTTPARGIETRLGVFPVQMAWANGDWKVSKRATDAPDYAELRHQPGTAEATAAGWQDFTR